MGNPLDAEFVDAGHTSTEKAAAIGEQSRSAFASDDGERVDVETVRQFTDQLREQTAIDERGFERLVADLEEKHQAYAKLLDGLPEMDAAEVGFVLRHTFATRGRHEAVRSAVGGVAGFNRAAHDLLDGDGDISARFDGFCERFPEVEESAVRSLASELLHFARPDRHHLWTRWLWNPESRTGVVPLVMMADVDVEGSTPGETYVRIGEAIEHLEDRVGELGFQAEALDGPLGTDVALATLHATYTYLVTGMRMTREFTLAVPDHPEYVRRLLGVQGLHERRRGRTEG